MDRIATIATKPLQARFQLRRATRLVRRTTHIRVLECTDRLGRVREPGNPGGMRVLFVSTRILGSTVRARMHQLAVFQVRRRQRPARSRGFHRLKVLVHQSKGANEYGNEDDGEKNQNRR